MSDFPNFYSCTDPKCGDNRCAERQEKAQLQQSAGPGLGGFEGNLKDAVDCAQVAPPVDSFAWQQRVAAVAKAQWAEKALANLARTDKLPRLAITVDNGFVSALIGGESVSLERIKLMADALAALEADGRRVQAAFGDKAVERG